MMTIKQFIRNSVILPLTVFLIIAPFIGFLQAEDRSSLIIALIFIYCVYGGMLAIVVLFYFTKLRDGYIIFVRGKELPEFWTMRMIVTSIAQKLNLHLSLKESCDDYFCTFEDNINNIELKIEYYALSDNVFPSDDIDVDLHYKIRCIGCSKELSELLMNGI